MSKNDIVQIAHAEGWTMSWNLNLFSGPKWHLVCGHCHHMWRQRIPLANYPILGCPNCRTVNRIPIEYTARGDNNG